MTPHQRGTIARILHRVWKMRCIAANSALVVAAWVGMLIAPGGPLRAQQDTEQIDLLVVRQEAHRAPEGLSIRARLREITPPEPTEIRWRHGGEGQGGEVIRGVFPKPGAAADEPQTIAVGEWSAPVPVVSLVTGRFPGRLFLTVTAGRDGRVVDRARGIKGEHSTGAVFEFEFSFAGRVVKRIEERGPDGGTATLVIPAERLVGDVQPDSPVFLDGLMGVVEYARRRAEFLEELPWAGGPLPRRYVLINNVSGYGEGIGYGIRTTNREATRWELRSLRQLGVNALRGAPRFVVEGLRAGEPELRAFGRGAEIQIAGFPVPTHRAGRPVDPEAGCPFAPGVAQRTEEAIAASLAAMSEQPVDEVWALTVDEIGSVFDAAPEGKRHVAVCPRCADGFRKYLKSRGLQPADFGAADWSEVRPLDVWSADDARPWAHDPRLGLAAYWTRDFNNYATAMLFTPLREAMARANAARPTTPRGTGGEIPGGEAGGTPPRAYSFALRGNTFLMGGHSLDFFDFYRYADNAIVYETSNREPRIWSWDSYLCDVQRVVGQRMGLAQGIYVKPHRGAPVQRMLAAVARGATMIYWYTYGPDYHKGDSFSQDPQALRLASKAAHLLGKAEPALYGARWAVPAEIAIVKPETTQRWMNLLGNPPALSAAWENAKWVYTALQHDHLPVDPLDERMVAEDDLSTYRVVYVNGTHVTRAAAAALRRYVEQGGTLWTSGGGLARDEANRSLDELLPVLGLRRRHEPEMWYSVALYGATELEPFDDARRRLGDVPPGAAVVAPEARDPKSAPPGDGPRTAGEPLLPVVGREPLEPGEGAEVVARFADGRAAVVRHRFGKGMAWTVGFFPGLEYSAPLRHEHYDMRRDLQASRRWFISAAARAVVRSVVEPDDALVEAILLRRPEGPGAVVVLANWAYAVRGWREQEGGRRAAMVANSPVDSLTVTVAWPRAALGEPPRRASSVWLEREIPFEAAGDTIRFVLPRLEEGDVVLLEP